MQQRSNHRLLALLCAGLAAASSVSAQSDATAAPPRDAGAAACAAPSCGPATPPHHGHRGHPEMGPGMRHLDTDCDGRVSREELLAAQKRQLERFDRADRNQDGTLSAEEMRAWRATRHEAPGVARPPCAPARSG